MANIIKLFSRENLQVPISANNLGSHKNGLKLIRWQEIFNASYFLERKHEHGKISVQLFWTPLKRCYVFGEKYDFIWIKQIKQQLNDENSSNSSLLLAS